MSDTRIIVATIVACGAVSVAALTTVVYLWGHNHWWRFSLYFRWYDLWVGLYFDRKNQALYIGYLPMLGIKVEFRLRRLPPGLRVFPKPRPPEWSTRFPR